MYFKWCPCPLVGIVATFANFFACFDCRVRANFDWDILLWALLLPPQTHTRAFASGQNRRSNQIALCVYYALAFRVIGIMFATNMQFLRIIYKIFFSVSFSTSAILLFGLSIIRAVPESIIDSCQQFKTVHNLYYRNCIRSTTIGINLIRINIDHNSNKKKYLCRESLAF